MAEYADLLLDSIIDQPIIKSKPPIWVTRSGERIKIKNMSTIHLRNSLKRCINKEWRIEYIPFLQRELKRRGLL